MKNVLMKTVSLFSMWYIARSRSAVLLAAFAVGIISAWSATLAEAACEVGTDGVTVTCTGNESDGIASGTDFFTPPITNLHVYTDPITTSLDTVSGINFSNSSASSVNIVSGSAGTPVAITTHGSTAPAIKAASEGSPSGYHWQSGLGLYVPNGPAGGGGPVTVESHSTIITSGANSPGIFAQNRVGAYNPLSALTLLSFSTSPITTSLISVAGNSTNIGTAVTGDNGGSFTLSSSGTVNFDRGTLGDSLQPGEYIVTSINYQVSLTRAWQLQYSFIPPGSQVSNGTAAVKIVNENGTIVVQPLEISFADFGVTSDPGGATPLWPDIQEYVNRLRAEEGLGGTGESIAVTNVGSITTLGYNSHGIYAETTGGNGATGSEGGLFDGPAGVGGTGSGGGGAAVTANGEITTYGNESAGVAAVSRGGNGGTGGDGGWGGWRWGGQGGTGGNGGDVSIYGSGTIETGAIPAGQTSTDYGDYSSGLIALSEGGNGGTGGEGHQGMPGGNGGFGGKGGTVVVEGNWSITTRGDKAHGIWAKSVGGNAGGGGSGGWLGGDGGAGGQATDGGSVTVASAGVLTTRGSDSYGIYAESVGGFGGKGGLSTGIFYSRGGDGNSAGSGGAVSVTNELQGSITTYGDRGHAIYAQSVGGGGGSGGGAGALVGFGGIGAYGGNGGTVAVTNHGSILTYGANARGIYAQSVGGGGGDGGGSGGFVAVGGAGSGTSDGKSVSVTNSGTIGTTGYRSHAIFAESVGGGGGDGGDSGGIFTIGGKGGGGGNAGTVTVANSGTLTTTGPEASGVFAQSVGGGGGNGGGAVAVGQLSVAIGGEAGDGGYGVKVRVDTESTSHIGTAGDRSYGILAQSVGGGGGNGGFAIAAGTGNGMHIAIGGTGGKGGAGGEVEVHAAGTIATGYRDPDTGELVSGKEAHGIFAQSVGGGGGSGGFAVSGALGGFNFNLGLGGSGGGGGTADKVLVGTEADPILASISTRGDRAYGILAQSVGGGGGDGGFAVSASVASATSLNLAVGGDGGGGGAGKEVGLYSSGSIHTEGANAHAIFAQSVGGGGGNGGFAITGSVASGAALDLSFGGNGGKGSTAADVTVWNAGQITTEGEQSYGILAQSVGGGGGNGGLSLSAGLTAFGGLNFSMGGNGGDGNSGGKVTVDNEIPGVIETWGEYSHGIFAQSVGGGGGNGGTAGSVTVNFSSLIPIPEPYPTGSANFSISLGGAGGQGGAGEDVDVDNNGRIVTHEDSAYGILAQSVGGGGGVGGKSVAATGNISLPEDPGTGEEKPQLEVKVDFALAIGGQGGDGNNGGSVTVVNDGVIDTSGVNSHGIFVQSVGGGGGAGGDARSLTLSIDPSNSSLFPSEPPPSLTSIQKSVNISVGGSAGGGSDGGEVTVTNNADIITRNADAYGIFAQSVGGGGGAGGGGYHGLDWSELGVPDDLVDIVEEVMPVESEGDVVVAVGGSGGASGKGARVHIENTGTIATLGHGSFGILAQSIGGGGGTGGVGAVGEEGTVGLGGRGGAAGDGGIVEVIVNGAIDTFGKAAHGIIAQSIGGGGGIAGNVDRGVDDFGLDLSFNPDLNSLFKESLPDGFIPDFNLDFNGNGGGAGNGGTVTITGTGAITTHDTGAYGIFAQSVGGGGGLAGGVGESSGFAGSVGGDGSGGLVTVSHTGTITTYGDASHGIFAQSAGGQKDAVQQQTTSTDASNYFKPVKDALGNFIFGTTNLADLADNGGNVNITVEGSILTFGTDSHGILAQSRGSDGNGNISITITSGTVQGGTGTGTGVYFMDGSGNTLENHGAISSLNEIAGTAIRGTGGNETINNYGSITGTIDLGAGTNAFTNGVTGIFNSGAAANIGSGNLFTNSGTLSPGGQGTFQTTDLIGNFAQSDTGSMAMEINRYGSRDKLLVSDGSVQLGGALTVSRGAGPYLDGMTYDIVESTNGSLNGVFNSVLLPTPGPLLSFVMNQTSSQVSVQVIAPKVTTVAANPAEYAMAEYLDRIMPTATDDLAAVLGEFQGLASSQLGVAISSMNSGSYTSLSKVSMAGIGLFLGDLKQRMGKLRVNMMNAERGTETKPVLLAYSGSAAELGRIVTIDQSSRDQTMKGLWINSYGQWGSHQALPGYAGYDYTLYGSAIGYDYTFPGNLLIGGSFGMSRAEVDFGSSQGEGSVNSVTGALYGSYYAGNAYIEGTFSYGKQRYHNSRFISVGSLLREASGKHDADSFTTYLGAGYNFTASWLTISPFTSLRHIHLAEEGFTEIGADSLNLAVESRKTDSLISELGIRLAHAFALGKGSLIPEVSAALNYDFDIDDQVVTASFAGAPGNTFSIRGEEVEKYGAAVAAGLTFIHRSGVSAVLKYRGEFRERNSSHGLMGEFRYLF